MSSRSSRSGSKSKSKGLRAWVHDAFSRSSSQLSPPESSHPSISPVSSTLEPPRSPRATNDRSQGQVLLPSSGRGPTITQSLSATSTSNPGPDLAPADLPTTKDANSIMKTTNPAWEGLLISLQALRDVSGVFGPLASAAKVLLECLDVIEAASRNQQDYEELATELAALSESLTQHFKETTSPTISKCVSSVSVGIERQAGEIQKKAKRGVGGKLREAGADEEDLVRHYRRVQSLFRQLQANLGMSTWSIANEILVNTRLEALGPEKQAAFDSQLSTSINRRTCTEGTRTGILETLVKWTYDPNAPAVYWMNGMAGTGKTTIACTFAEWLERHELLAASFFCTRTSVDCKDATRIVPTIVYQLARYSASFQSTLYDILSAEPDAGSKNITKQFERLLKEPLDKMKGAMLDNLVVVIDALDECDDPSGVGTILDMLFQYASYVPLKFFVTGRPESGIYAKMSEHIESHATVHLHEIEKSLVQADIELYLKEQLAFMSPNPSDIEQLVQRSGALFIYAATLVRYIQPIKQRADPQKRLRAVLGMTPEAMKDHAQIDALYTAVLKSALSEDELEADETEDIRVVLRTVLFAQEPISLETIAKLSGIDTTRRVEYALQPLRSVLHQSETTGLVSTLHASFPDFMFDTKRSGSYFCDVIEHRQLLAERCFSVMKEQLVFNICELESSFVSDKDVDGIQERVKQKVSPTLAYACRYWANHLVLASMSDDLSTSLVDFFSHRLLFWMEVLNLRREMVAGIEALLKAKKWLNEAAPASSDLVMLLEDARNFMTGFANSSATISTPHIYISSFPFCPRSSTVYKNYWKRTTGLLKLKGSLMERREAAALATWNIGSPVYSLAYSPGGTQLAVGCDDKTVRILNAHDGTMLVDPLQGHTGSVTSVAFSPNGKLVASGSDDGTIRVWNAHNGTPFAGLFEGHEAGGSIRSVCFSPDTTRIISAYWNDVICIWDVNDGKCLLGPWKDPSMYILACILSPNGTHLAYTSPNNAVTLCNVHTQTPSGLFQGHNGIVSSLAFTPDGSRLVSGSNDRTIRVWNTSDGSLATDPFQGHTDGVNSVAVSPDGTRVASGSDDYTVRVWNIDDGSLFAGPFTGHTGSIRSVTFSPDGTRVASGSYDGTVRAWHVRDGLLSPPAPFHEHMSNLISTSLFNNGTRILSGSTYHSIWVWDISCDGIIPNPLKGFQAPLAHPHLSPITGHFAVSDEDHCINILDATDNSLVVGPLQGHTEGLSSFTFAVDGIHLVTGSKDFTIRMWNLQKSELAAGPFRGHGGWVTSVALSSDSSRIVSCSTDDRTIRVWNVDNTILCIDPPASDMLATSKSNSVSTLKDWKIRKDGWVTNGGSELLLWIPFDFASLHASPSPHTEFIITRDGILHIPQQELLLGEQWSRCYLPD